MFIVGNVLGQNVVCVSVQTEKHYDSGTIIPGLTLIHRYSHLTILNSI